MQNFVVSCRLILQPPQNLAQVVSTLRSAVSNIQAQINVKVNPSTLRQTAQVANQMKTVTKAAKQATDQIADFGHQSYLAIKRFAAFTVITTGFIELAGAIRSGLSEAVQFNKLMIQVGQVTGRSLEGVKGIGGEISRLSKTLGVSSIELAKSAKVLSQAGLSAEDTKIAMEALAKTSLAPTFDSIEQSTEGAIAAFRQFKIEAKDLEKMMGAVNAVSARYAVESSDIITAIQRTGGAFAAAGGSLNELMALFTSVRATTRESAETIATGFRTIFTRMQRGGTIEFLENLNIKLRDTAGQFIGPYKAIGELSKALANIPSTDPRFAQIMEELGGFRQISKVIPMIQQYAIAQEALGIAMSGQGSLAKDAITAQQALLVQFTRTRESFMAMIRGFMDDTAVRSMITLMLGLAESATKLVDSLRPILPMLVIIGGMKLFPLAGRFLSGFGPKKMARGGVVPGYGSGDTIPAALQPGEFVLKKSAAQAYGYDNLVKINRMASGGSIQRFAEGGFKEGPLDAGELEKLNRLSGKGKLKSFEVPVFNRLKARRDAEVSRGGIYDIASVGIMPGGYYKGNEEYKGESGRFFNVHRSALSKNTTDAVMKSMHIGISDIIKSVGGSLAGSIGAAFNKTGMLTFMASKGSQDTEGHLFEGIIASIGAPYALKNEVDKGIDFPQGIGNAAKLFNPAIAGIKYIDATRDVQSKSMNKFVSQVDNYMTSIGMAGGGSVDSVDSVPSLLTPGEFVFNKQAVGRIGVGNLRKMNRMARGGLVQKFAFGSDNPVGGEGIVPGSTGTIGGTTGPGFWGMLKQQLGEVIGWFVGGGNIVPGSRGMVPGGGGVVSGGKIEIGADKFIEGVDKFVGGVADIDKGLTGFVGGAQDIKKFGEVIAPISAQGSNFTKPPGVGVLGLPELSSSFKYDFEKVAPVSPLRRDKRGRFRRSASDEDISGWMNEPYQTFLPGKVVPTTYQRVLAGGKYYIGGAPYISSGRMEEKSYFPTFRKLGSKVRGLFGGGGGPTGKYNMAGAPSIIPPTSVVPSVGASGAAPVTPAQAEMGSMKFMMLMGAVSMVAGQFGKFGEVLGNVGMQFSIFQGLLQSVNSMSKGGLLGITAGGKHAGKIMGAVAGYGAIGSAVGGWMQEEGGKQIAAGQGGADKYKAGRAVATSGQFAAYGALAGSMIGGPIGMAIGGVGGAITGAVYGFVKGGKEAEDLVAGMKFDKMFEKFNKRLKDVNEGKTVAAMQLGTVKAGLTEGFGTIRATHDITKRQDILGKMQQSAPDLLLFMGNLSKSVGASVDSTKVFEEFTKIVGQDTIDQFMMLSSMTIPEFRTQMEDTIKINQNVVKAQMALRDSTDIVVSRMTAISAFTTAVSEAGFASERFSKGLDMIVSGGLGTPTYMGAEKMFESPDKFMNAGAFAGQVGRVTSITGGLGKDAINAFQAIQRITPALLAVRSANPLGEVGAVETFRNQFTGIPKDIVDMMTNVIQEGIIGEEAKPEKFLSEIGKNIGGTAEKIAAGLKPLIGVLQEQDKMWTTYNNEFAAYMTKSLELMQKETGIRLEGINIEQQRIETMAKLRDQNVNPRQIAMLDRMRLSTILGSRWSGTNATPENIGADVRSAQAEVYRIQKEMAVATADKFAGLDIELTKYQDIIGRGNNALEFLSKASERAGAAMLGLEQARERRKFKMGVLEEFAGAGSPQQVNELGKKIGDAIMLSRGLMGIQGIRSEERSGVLSFLENIPGGMKVFGGKKGTDIKEKAILDFAMLSTNKGGLGLSKEDAKVLSKTNPEEDKHLRTIEETFKTAGSATEQLRQNIAQQNTQLITGLSTLQTSLLQNLDKIMSDFVRNMNQSNIVAEQNKWAGAQQKMMLAQSIAQKAGIPTTTGALLGLQKSLGELPSQEEFDKLTNIRGTMNRIVENPRTSMGIQPVYEELGLKRAVGGKEFGFEQTTPQTIAEKVASTVGKFGGLGGDLKTKLDTALLTGIGPYAAGKKTTNQLGQANKIIADEAQKFAMEQIQKHDEAFAKMQDFSARTGMAPYAAMGQKKELGEMFKGFGTEGVNMEDWGRVKGQAGVNIGRYGSNIQGINTATQLNQNRLGAVGAGLIQQYNKPKPVPVEVRNPAQMGGADFQNWIDQRQRQQQVRPLNLQQQMEQMDRNTFQNLQSGTTNLYNAAQQITQATVAFPHTIEMTGKHELFVNFTGTTGLGTEIANNLKDSLKQVAVVTVRKEITNAFPGQTFTWV